MRVALLLLLVGFLCVYAYRDWFKSLCGLILLMAVMQHPDMPTNILGIQGMNPWNVLMANVLMGWMLARQREGLVWDMPRALRIMLLLYLAVVVVGFGRMMLDRRHLDEFSTGYLIGEYFINCIKWVIPGLLLFDGCRTRPRFTMALVCILGVYVLLAAQVIRWMPQGAGLSGQELTYRSRKIIQNEVGYHPVNMSMMLAGACWALVATLPLARGWKTRLAIGLCAVAVAYGQALTGGRMGYATWAVVGLTLCLLRWRKQLLLLPIAVIVVAAAVPAASERFLQGFGQKGLTGQAITDDYEVTSGRTLIWPLVIEKITESPAVGYGRLAMYRTGLKDKLWNELREAFPHPHNAYLECLLDNGLAGALCVWPFYLMILYLAGRLFMDNTAPAYRVIGGVTLALVLALLVAAMGSQTFYPREGAVGMWATIGVMLRMNLMREQAVARAALAAARGVTNRLARAPARPDTAVARGA